MKKFIAAIRQTTSFLMIYSMLFSTFAFAANAGTVNSGKTKLTEDQKILHVLNRLGFGARLGDVEKVKSIGLQKYIEQQLNPGSINDSVAENKVSGFDVLKMSNEELFAKYPSPATVLQAVARQNGLSKGDLAQLKQQNKDQKEAKNAPSDGSMTKENGAMANDEKTLNEKIAAATPEERQKYQAQVQEIYQKYNFGRPQQISQQLNASRILRAVYSERQLQEQMVDFWTNHFNVYAAKQSVRWFTPQYDRDVIRPNALGNFKDLLLATAKSPAMLYYLDNFQSVSPNTQIGGAKGKNLSPEQRLKAMENPRVRERIKQRTGLNDAELDARIKRQQQNPNANQQQQKRGINENYAREIMELHTLGVDGGYSLKDIQEIARCFTGWTIVDPRGYRKAAAEMISGKEDKRGARLAQQAGIPENAESGTFVFVDRLHDKGDKMVLGQKISGGGMEEGLKVIDILANHPSTAKFIARKLAVKFVNDNPSEALVNRLAAEFTKSHGDIKSTLRALFTSDEFYAPENYRAKIKTPFELTISAIRAVGADTNGGQVQAMLAKMGEQLYNWQAPTGYPDTAEDWVNTGALLERLNFAVALSSNRIPQTKVNLSRFEGKNKDVILDKAIAEILGGEIAPNTKATLLKQLDQPLIEPKMDAKNDEMEMQSMPAQQPIGGLNIGGRQQGQQARLLPPSGNPEVFKVIGLILGSPDFQRQ